MALTSTVRADVARETGAPLIDVAAVEIAGSAIARVPRAVAIERRILPIAIDLVNDVDEELVIATPLAERYKRAMAAIADRRVFALEKTRRAAEKALQEAEEARERERAGIRVLHPSPNRDEADAEARRHTAIADPEAEAAITQLRRTAQVDYLRFVYADAAIVQKRTLEVFGKEPPRDSDAHVNRVNEVLHDCVYRRFTDLEVSPLARGGQIKGLVDHTWVEFPSLTTDEEYDRFVTILKTRAAGPNLQAGTSNTPQDGHMAIELPHRRVDVRVNVIPMQRRESVWLRFHDLDISVASPERLGIPGDVLRALDDALLQSAPANVEDEELFNPFGIVAIVGPQGTGKTTTYESYMLHRLVPNNLRCVEVGNPIERQIYEIAQLEVNDRSNMSFEDIARALKRRRYFFTCYVEARDEEGMKALFSSGSTGGLTGVTSHGADALTFFEKLTEYKIPFNQQAEYVKLVLAQRLVRRLCSECKEPEIAPARLLKYRAAAAGEVIFRAIGCDSCYGTGYRRELAVFEKFRPTPDFWTGLAERKTSHELYQIARDGGYVSMFEHALDRIMAGQTSVDEVFRKVPKPR